MIAGHPTYPLTLAYGEVAAVEYYLESLGTSLERKTVHASFSANAHGITIIFPRQEDQRYLWDMVLAATREEDGE